MRINRNTTEEKSEIIEQMPMACADETAAVEFFEERLWKGTPKCAHCQSARVYQMKDAKTGQRNKRFLWRCHDCKKQFTVRIGTVLEESRLPLRAWVYAFWRASTSKKGVSAKEIQRQCQISYEGALFLMHRIRYAMTQGISASEKMTGIVEVDETYIGGKPRVKGISKRGRGTKKTPVMAILQRDGKLHRRTVANITGHTLKGAIRECVDTKARIMTDEFGAYRGLHREFASHEIVNHGSREYVRGDVTTNTAESCFAILKRGINGIFHAVSKKHLHRYLGEFDFRWNHRNINDGERTVAAVENAIGKRLSYEECIA